VNLLLVEPSELRDLRIELPADDRRAQHLRGVLGASLGSRVRAGVIGGPLGTAEVVADRGGTLVLALSLGDVTPAPLPVDLVLAIPRPKALLRTLEAAASFGVASIALTNAWRVDKSYLRSPRLAPGSVAAAARLGAEQGATTHLPSITIHHRLMELVDARWPAPGPGDAARLIAHPGGMPIELAVRAGPVTLAIGPEGGWIAREVETFVSRGFTPVSLGEPILRVETAVGAALGQLLLLRRVTAR